MSVGRSAASGSGGGVIIVHEGGSNESRVDGEIGGKETDQHKSHAVLEHIPSSKLSKFFSRYVFAL
jgi:hypothetical protein